MVLKELSPTMLKIIIILNVIKALQTVQNGLTFALAELSKISAKSIEQEEKLKLQHLVISKINNYILMKDQKSFDDFFDIT